MHCLDECAKRCEGYPIWYPCQHTKLNLNNTQQQYIALPILTYAVRLSLERTHHRSLYRPPNIVHIANNSGKVKLQLMSITKTIKMALSTPYSSHTTIATLLLLLLTSCVSFAFQPSTRYSPQSPAIQQQYNHRYTISSSSKIYSTIVDEIPSDATLDDDSTTSSSSSYSGDPEEILQSRNKLLALSLTLTNNTPSGKIFINRPYDKIKLQNAINNLEGLVGSSSQINEKKLLGDWKLICTANLPTSDIRRRFDNNNSDDKKKKKRSPLSSPFNKSNSKLSPLQKSLQNSIQVTQRIRNDGTTGGTGISGEYNINRVDNVIEITPLNTLESVLPTDSPLQRYTK